MHLMRDINSKGQNTPKGDPKQRQDNKTNVRSMTPVLFYGFAICPINT